MAGLVPAIHAEGPPQSFRIIASPHCRIQSTFVVRHRVDARDKRGHDGGARIMRIAGYGMISKKNAPRRKAICRKGLLLFLTSCLELGLYPKSRVANGRNAPETGRLGSDFRRVLGARNAPTTANAGVSRVTFAQANHLI
jgi:hypothetical protein